MSNIGVQNVQRMRYIEEAAASFAIDKTGSLGSFVDIPFIEGSCTFGPDTPTESPGHARQYRDAHPTEINMVPNCPLTFQVNLSVPDARGLTTIAEPNAMQLFGTAWGGSYLGTGDTINDVTPGTSEFDVTTAARWAAGKAMGLLDANGLMHIREIQGISSSTVTLKSALPFTPTNGATLYACGGYYLGNNDPDSVTSMQFIIEGLGAGGDYEDCWVLRGGQITGGMSLDLPIAGIPRATFNVTCVAIENGDDAALTPAALAAATYTNTNEVLVADGHLLIGEVAAGSQTEYHGRLSVGLDGIKYIPIRSPGGTNTVAAYVMGGEHPKVTATLELPYEDQTWSDGKAAATKYYITLQMGSSSSTGAMMIALPNMQVTQVERMDYDGVQGQKITFKGSIDEDCTLTTEIGRSPIRLHFA